MLKTITVPMASYNGNRYIRQQPDSILAQSEEDICIPVPNDCSLDGSRELLKEYEASRGDRVLVLLRKEPSGGTTIHFPKLLKLMTDAAHGPEEQPQHGSLLPEHEMIKSQLTHLGRPAGTDYFMLNDQDDAWMSQKARILSDRVKEMERGPGRGNVPPLVHSDLTVANKALRPITDSFFRCQRISPERINLPQLLVQNSVAGGAVMVSRSMLPYLKEVLGVCFMRDVWLTPTVSCFGEIGRMDRPLHYYRWHGGNTLGAERGDSLDSARIRIKDGNSARENYRKMSGQADSFYHMFYDRLNREQQETLEAFIRLPRCGRLGKIGLIAKYGFIRNTPVCTLGRMLFIGD